MHEAFVRQFLAMSFVFMYISLLNSEIDDILDKKMFTFAVDLAEWKTSRSLNPIQKTSINPL